MWRPPLLAATTGLTTRQYRAPTNGCGSWPDMLDASSLLGCSQTSLENFWTASRVPHAKGSST